MTPGVLWAEHVNMPNRDPLRTHLEGLLGASLPDYHVFQRAVSSIALQPQDLLFDVGIVDRRFFFVVAGILSVGIVQGSGREWIRRFAGPGELVSGVPPPGHPVGGAAAALHAMPAQTRGQLILTCGRSTPRSSGGSRPATASGWRSP